MQTELERFDIGNRRSERFTPDTVTLQDRNLWSGLKVEGWAGAPQELEEAVLPGHTVFVNIGTPVTAIWNWPGHPGFDKPFNPHHLGIVPASLPIRAVSTSFSSTLVMVMRPDYLSAIGDAWQLPTVDLKLTFGIQDAFILNAALTLAEDIRDGNLYGALYGESIQAALAAHLLRHYSGGAVPIPRADLGSPVRIREMLLDQLGTNLKLADLAQELDTDVSTFTRWFRRTFGLPPHQFIMRERIARAKVLLRSTHEPLTNIALRCGFNSHSHFSTVFKRAVGITPIKFRSPGLESS